MLSELCFTAHLMMRGYRILGKTTSGISKCGFRNAECKVGHNPKFSASVHGGNSFGGTLGPGGLWGQVLKYQFYVSKNSHLRLLPVKYQSTSGNRLPHISSSGSFYTSHPEFLKSTGEHMGARLKD